jgi:hypothetical protein
MHEMNIPPKEIGGASVLKYAFLRDGIKITGNILHLVNGQELPTFHALAICKYKDKEDHCIFYCDSRWTVMTALSRDTLDAALAQAECEFKGISKHWKDLA